MFGKLSDMVKHGKALSFESAFFSIFSDEEIQDEIIYLNTDEQLFTDGVNAEGVKLTSIGGEYAFETVLNKQSEGLPYLHVTLYDTGEFYDSFKIVPQKDGVLIEADTIKEGEDLQDRWGDEILGLNEASLESLRKTVAEELVRYVLEKLLGQG